MVHHSINGSFAIREGDWKLCLCPDSGGWSDPRPGKARRGLPKVQLYDLRRDAGERTNVQDRHPEIVERLTRRLHTFIENGRSTPGKPQKNAAPVKVGAR